MVKLLILPILFISLTAQANERVLLQQEFACRSDGNTYRMMLENVSGDNGLYALLVVCESSYFFAPLSAGLHSANQSDLLICESLSVTPDLACIDTYLDEVAPSGAATPRQVESGRLVYSNSDRYAEY